MWRQTNFRVQLILQGNIISSNIIIITLKLNVYYKFGKTYNYYEFYIQKREYFKEVFSTKNMLHTVHVYIYIRIY